MDGRAADGSAGGRGAGAAPGGAGRGRGGTAGLLVGGQWQATPVVTPADVPGFEPAAQVESGNTIVQDSVFLTSHCAPASPLDTGIIVSTDGGQTWARHDLKEFGKRSPTRFRGKSSEGRFRMDLRSGWVAHAEVLFLQPKEA